MGRENLGTIVKGGLAGLALVGGLGALGYSYFVPDTIETTVVGTEVKRYNDRDKYLVFTEDGVFENTDCWYRLKFRSSDLQAELMALDEADAKVEITKYGWRIPLFSKYENIIKVKPAGE